MSASFPTAARASGRVLWNIGVGTAKRTFDVALGGLLLLTGLNFVQLVTNIPLEGMFEILLAGSSTEAFLYYAFTILFVWTVFVHTVAGPEDWFGGEGTERSTEPSVFGEVVYFSFKTLYVAVIVLTSAVVVARLGTVSLVAGLAVGASMPVFEATFAKAGRTPPLFLLAFLVFLSLVPSIVLGALIVSVFKRTPNLLLSAWEMVDESVEEAIRSSPNGRSVADVIGSFLSRRSGAR
jgi:hypothetical protein